MNSIDIGLEAQFNCNDKSEKHKIIEEINAVGTLSDILHDGLAHERIEKGNEYSYTVRIKKLLLSDDQKKALELAISLLKKDINKKIDNEDNNND